jgi:hypothetical protein
MAMAKTFRLPADEPLLNIASYGRGGPRGEIRLSTAEVEHIRRTVQRTPEVMVKVLSRASNDLGAAGKHIDYISRKGELVLETDDDALHAHVSGKALLEEWDLDVDDARRQSTLSATNGRKPSKLIHKLLFSMPPGTPPARVLAAVRYLAREEFWGQHRYALVLHTDEAHSHVHLVLKAASEKGVRLNIKKATLRHWRSEFARHLRLLGVEANATERAVRGQSRKARKDGIYRASLRGDSDYVSAQAHSVAAELVEGTLRSESGRRTLVATRDAVVSGWNAVANTFASQGHLELSDRIANLVEQMEKVRTDREWIAHELLRKTPIRTRGMPRG